PLKPGWRAKGDPGTSVSVPVLGSTVNTLTSLDTMFAANRNWPTIATPMRLAANSPSSSLRPPVTNGEPGTGVSEPSGPTEKPETAFWKSPLLVYTKLLCAYRLWGRSAAASINKTHV